MTIQSIFRLGKAAGVAAALMASTEANAQWGRRNCPPQPCDVPQYMSPGISSAPGMAPSPITQPGTATPTNPSTTTPGQAASPNLTDQIANSANNFNQPSSFAAAGAPQNLAPNMIGDFFSANSNSIRIPKLRPGFYDGATGTANWPTGQVVAPLTNGQPINFSAPSNNGFLAIALANGGSQSLPFALLGITTQLDASSIANFAPGANPSPIALSTANTTVDQAYQAARLFVINAETAQLQPGETLASVNVAVNGGTATRSGTGGPDPTVGEPFSIAYVGSAQTLVASNQSIFVDVNSPSGGGIFGRLKISENNSPMPRDRVFFDYSYFSDVPIANNGAHVQVFRPGFEKTFFNGMASFECRVPFAATVDSTQNADGPLAYNTEFGNVTLGAKALLYSNGTWAFSVGAATIIPTADDQQVNLFGIPLVRVNNEAYHLQPYLAALWTPSDRFFVQSFVQFDFCLNGNSVYFDPAIAGALTKTGHLNDQNSLFIDVGAGFWLVRNEDGNSFVRGIAPIAELHYNQSMNKADVVGLGALGVGDLSGNYSILNTTLGINFDLRTNTTMMLGVALPLTADRQFNYELSLQLNQRFGTAGRAPLTSPDF